MGSGDSPEQIDRHLAKMRSAQQVHSTRRIALNQREILRRKIKCYFSRSSRAFHVRLEQSGAYDGVSEHTRGNVRQRVHADTCGREFQSNAGENASACDTRESALRMCDTVR